MGILKKYPAIFWGVFITVVFLGFGYFRVDFLDAIELKLYDLRMNLGGDEEKSGKIVSSEKIVLVDIDNDSVEKLGRWPWPRDMVAKGIDKINEAGPRIIGLNIIYSEPERDAGLRELHLLRDRVAELFPKQPDTDTMRTELLGMMDRAVLRLDKDGKLAESLRKSGKVVLPVFFRDSLAPEEKENRLLAAQALRDVGNPEKLKFVADYEIEMPIDLLSEAAAGLGHVNLKYDMDGKVRREQIFYNYQGIFIPCFSLRLAALYHGVSNEQIRAVVGNSVSVNLLDIPLTPESDFLVSFRGAAGAFRRYSFYDVLNDKIPQSVFRDRIVLITPSAAGILNPISTPAAQTMTVGEFTANTIWAMLRRQFVRQPSWGGPAVFLMMFLTGGMITFVLPRLKALIAGMVFIVMAAVLMLGSVYLFVSHGLWIRITYPLLLLVFGYMGMVTLKYFATETSKEKIEGESAESNRMLGLTFQGQGQLDMAFEKFRKVPVNDDMKRVLYNLGLDFERKRQFSKAASVYEYIEEHDSTFKDVSKRKKKLVQASETMVFSDGFLSSSSTGDGLMASGSDIRPTLGRYEISKQLGKGAMGVVYLGMDPRINRTTAIKTFRFSSDFEQDELDDLKKKFFREAESAGTLSHPNIVTIYDAGEEHELAYIAMEYLDGKDLKVYTKKKNLLPMRKVIGYVADIAEALDYAHKKGIVHRDIKPANIMLIKSGVVKITDFGIARITASSQTQTGVVKGTPHYMSPEQISGEKVDGRSDIFSLGAMLFQLLTGDVPFHGNSPAALLHQILNMPQPDPRKLNPKLLKPHVAIINKAMEKDREQRYQEASRMAAHLRTLAKKLDAIKAGRSEK